VERLRENYDALLHLSNAALDNKQREIAAMRTIVEAVAEAHDNDDVCPVLCSLTFFDSAEPDADYPRHDEPCVGEQARAYLAAHPAVKEEVDG